MALPRDGPALIATPEGYVLLTPLPDDWWLTFIGDLYDDELERLERDRSAETIAGLLSRRITGKLELVDVDWASKFQMHRRIASRLAGERWFLLGDAGHLSSPFGGEGLNSGLHDGHNLAWKLALTVQGRARGALLDSFEPERSSPISRGSRSPTGCTSLARRGRGGAHRRTPAASERRSGGGARAGARCSTSPTPAARWSAKRSPNGDAATRDDLHAGGALSRRRRALHLASARLLFGAADATAVERLRDLAGADSWT